MGTKYRICPETLWRAVRFVKAVAQNQKYAQYFLGSLYYRGNGVAQDYAETLRLYDLSASQGHPYADYELANIMQFVV